MPFSITQVIIGVNPCGPLRELEMRSFDRLSLLLPLVYLRCVRRQFVLIRLYAHDKWP